MRKLWMLWQSFIKLTIQNSTVLFSTMIQAAMKYCVQVRHTCLKKDSYLRDRVQRRGTKLIWRMQQLSFEWRLETLSIYSVSNRRSGGYQIAFCHILKDHFGVKLGNWLKLDLFGKREMLSKYVPGDEC